MIKPVRTLSREDFDLAWELAKARMNAANINPAEADGWDPLRVEVIGTMAEIGLCRWYGTEVDETIYKKRKDAGADITVDGCTANIKGTATWGSPHLIVPFWDLKYSAYICVSVDDKGGRIKPQGYISRKELKEYEPSYFRPTSRKKTRNVHCSNLKPLRIMQGVPPEGIL